LIGCSAFQEARKRKSSPTVLPSQPPIKVNKPIPSGPRVVVPGAPTGPRNSAPRIPTGPKSLFTSSSSTSRPIPTGPKSLTLQTASYSTTTLAKPSSPRSDLFPSSPRGRQIDIQTPDLDPAFDMPPRGSSRGGRASSKSGGSTPRSARGGTPSSSRGTKSLEGPLMDKDEILRQYGHINIKEQWLDNPKSPLSNHFGGKDPGYKVVEGVVGGTKVFRATIIASEDGRVVGVGDGGNKKDAEKLAALSAVLQLAGAGIVSVFLLSGDGIACVHK